MRKSAVCVNNQFVGILSQESSSVLSFSYDKDYLKQPDAVPLSLSLPLKSEPQKNHILSSYINTLVKDLDHCFRECTSSDVGNVSFGPQITKQPRLYSSLSMDHLAQEILFKIPSQSESPHGGAAVPLAQCQPYSSTTVIDSSFYHSPFSLLKTHILKKELSKEYDLITNEIFITLIASQLEIPVPTISRFMLDDDYILMMDRPDRKASTSPTILPIFQHCETLETALIAFTHGLKEKEKQSPEFIFDLLRQFSWQPAVDFRTLIRTIMVCLTAGVDEFHLSSALISLKPQGCRLHQVRHFMCSDIYEKTSKKFLHHIFSIKNIRQLEESHFDELARKIRVNNKYLKSQALSYALVIPKIGEEILVNYPSLSTEITAKIMEVIKQRTKIIEGILA